MLILNLAWDFKSKYLNYSKLRPIHKYPGSNTY